VTIPSELPQAAMAKNNNDGTQRKVNIR